MKPVLLDLFCGAGGCTKGYQEAGFYVVGVDVKPQPNYCGEQFVQVDAIDALQCLLAGSSVGGWTLGDLSAAHASPPCQAYSGAQRIQGRKHPELIAPARKLLQATGLPYVIENVPGAPLEHPHMLCGTMFGLPLYRHRLFETPFPYTPPLHGEHVLGQAKMGRPAGPNEIIQVVGTFSGVQKAREAMGIDWMTRNELSEAIPPAYTRHVGEYLLRHLALSTREAGWW